MKILQLFIPVLFLLVSCTTPMKKDSVVVATNSWTAAYATAAGARNVVVLAPYEMVHPSEYELKATDIPLIVNARVIVYAGYETMVKRLQSGMNLKEEVLLKIETDYSMAVMEKSVMEIAQRLGTEQIAIQNLDSIRHLMIEGRRQLDKSGLNSIPVLVNFFQQSIVKEMGFEVAGVFGPAALEAGDINRMAQPRSGMIVDNEHNPLGLPLKKIKSASDYRQLINFPGMHNTKTLEEVIKYNIGQLSTPFDNILK